MQDDSTTEEWRVIPGYPDYAVSSLGRVKRVTPHPTNGLCLGILRPSTDRDGYFRCDLSRRGERQRHFMVHRIVAMTFLPPKPTPKHEINHIDGVKVNNRPKNLEWVTSQQNHQHAFRLGLRVPIKGEQNGQAKLTTSQVFAIRALQGKSRPFQVAPAFGVTPSNITAIWNRKSWRHLNP